MSYTSYKSYTKNFNFENPNWEDFPGGFLDITKTDLTKEESHLLDAIKLAWLTTTSTGRKYLFKKTYKRVALVSMCLISLIGLISLITSSSQERLIKPVNAAATISATLKYLNLEP